MESLDDSDQHIVSTNDPQHQLQNTQISQMANTQVESSSVVEKKYSRPSILQRKRKAKLSTDENVDASENSMNQDADCMEENPRLLEVFLCKNIVFFLKIINLEML